MSSIRIAGAATLKDNEKKVITAGETELLLIRQKGRYVAVQAKCPHAGAPLEKGALCEGQLVCPWHMATFALPDGELLEPPAMEALKTYQVQVEGEDILVDLEPIERLKKPAVPDARSFVLIGAGAAGAMAAKTLRTEGFNGRITVIDPIADEPVDRTQLTKNALNGKMPVAKTKLDVLDELKVERIHAAVVSLDAKGKKVALSDGSEHAFDAALIATGGAPKRLEVPGAEHVHTIRHAADVERILAVTHTAMTAIVIGTSFIGLEAASALRQKGLNVTVVGRDKLPFAKRFGERVAKAMVALHEKKGVAFHLGVEIASISDAGVTVAAHDGKLTTLPAGLVIAGVGVSPRVNFEHDLPTAKDQSIATDESLAAAPSVWAAGDIATVKGTRIEHWRLAQQHGMAAARQMLGRGEALDGVPFFWTTHFDKRFGYLGHAQEWDEIVYDGSVEELKFIAFYVKDENVAAILTCGRDHETAMLAEQMRQKASLAKMLKTIAKG